MMTLINVKFEFLALKSPITTEKVGFKSLILDTNKLKLEQNVSNSSEVGLGDLQRHVRKHFFFPILLSVTKDVISSI